MSASVIPITQPTSMLAYAKRYQAVGYWVLPLMTGTKQPFARLVPNGVHGASNDIALITKWWTAEPNAGIGIAVKASGLVVVDIDPRNGGYETLERLEATHGPLVSDVLQFTGGGGEHRVFASQLVENLPGKLGTGIDLKADGYICAAPSIHPNGIEYVWEGSSDPLEGCLPSSLPGWVRDLARGPFNAVPFIAATRFVDPKQLADLRQALSTIDSDDYIKWVNYGNALIELGQEGFKIWDEWSQKSSKYSAQAVTRKWRSFKPGKFQLESIFYEAQNIGWINPATVAPELEVAPISASVAMIEKSSEPVIQPTPESTTPLELLSLPGVMGDCMNWITRTAQRPQPILALAATLSLFATALSTKIASATRLRTNLYLVSVAGTSAGKDHGRKQLAKMLSRAHLEDLIGGDDLGSGQGLLSRAHKCPRSVFQIDEFGMMLQSIRSKNAGTHLASIVKNLMMLFGSTDSIYRGTEYADQKLRPRMDIEYPCINLHATTTPEQFFPALGSADITSGALNRILVLVAPEGIVSRQEPTSEEPPEHIVYWIEQIQLLHKGIQGGLHPAHPIIIPNTADAKALFNTFGLWIDDYSRKSSDPQVVALWGRAWETAVKLAMIHLMARQVTDQIQRLVESDSLKIDAQSAQWGIDFTKHFISSMERDLTARMGDSEFDILVKECIRVIKNAKHKGRTAAELGRYCPSYQGKEPRIQDAVHIAMLRREACAQVNFPSKRGPSRNAWVHVDFIEPSAPVAPVESGNS